MLIFGAIHGENKMLIKLTNAAESYLGKPVLLNTDHIISVFEIQLEGTEEVLTQVYATTKESWTVKETVQEIYAMLN
jgi:hypothetical protein